MVTDEQVLLHGFSSEDRRSFLAMGRERIFDADEVIVEESTPGTSLHIVMEGAVAVWKRHVKLLTLSKGAIVGEMVIFRERPRSATVRAETLVKTLSFEKADIMAFFKWRDERLFKYLVINMIHILARKLARGTELVAYLQSRVQSREERRPLWVRSSIL
jgi:CRP-like cAMP-binding protein